MAIVKNDYTNSLIERGVEEIIVEAEFLRLLQIGRPLRLKMGFDPSAPDLHLGHAVGLRKLRQLQDLGHKVIVIVGDWTAQIGDPSGQSSTRPMLSQSQVMENAKTYMEQFFRVVDRDRTETRFQSEWFGSFTLENLVRLTQQFTVAQFLAREDFSKRFESNQPIALTELLYPLLQAYDSVQINSDVEFGGTDQKFNLLVGRDLQEKMGLVPQQCFLMPILVGTDGAKKMSKSLGNYIGLNETPDEMYGKTMSLPDSAIVSYMENLTDIDDIELAEIKLELDRDSVNPMELKKRLAREIVSQFHEGESALAAEQYFERTVQRGETPEDVPTYELPSREKLDSQRISSFLVASGLVESTSEARRLINQGAVRLNNEVVTDNVAASILVPGDMLTVGRRRIIRVF